MTEQPEINVSAQCPDCKVDVVTNDKNDEQSVVYCPQCKREFGSWASVKAKMRKAGVDHLKEKLNETFKGSKGWTIKP